MLGRPASSAFLTGTNADRQNEWKNELTPFSDPPAFFHSLTMSSGRGFGGWFWSLRRVGKGCNNAGRQHGQRSHAPHGCTPCQTSRLHESHRLIVSHCCRTPPH